MELTDSNLLSEDYKFLKTLIGTTGKYRFEKIWDRKQKEINSLLGYLHFET